jgi:hypothetical protein
MCFRSDTSVTPRNKPKDKTHSDANYENAQVLAYQKITPQENKTASLANASLCFRVMPKCCRVGSKQPETIGYLVQQTHAISTSLPSLHDLSCSGKMSICLHCGLLSQECQCERAEYDSFQRHALGQNRRMLEDIELGGRGMVRMLDLVGSPDL